MRTEICLLAGVLVVWGCGDDVISSGDGGASGSDGGSSEMSGGDGGGSSVGSGDTSMQGTGSGSGESSEVGTSESGTTSDGGGSDPGSTDQGTGGSTNLRFSMLDLVIAQNCMPIVPADPVTATWDLRVRNDGEIPGDADVVSATFLDGADAPLGTFEVTPTNTRDVEEAQTVVVPMAKTVDSLDPASGCAVLVCDEVAKVELVVDADDTGMVAVVGSATVECSF